MAMSGGGGGSRAVHILTLRPNRLLLVRADYLYGGSRR